MRPWLVLGMSAALVLAAACGDDDAPSSSPTTVMPTTPATGAPAATAPSSTAPATTAPATTAPATTGVASLPPLEPGWRPIDVATVEGQAAFPCCADTWHGVPSPPLPVGGETLVDGDYAVTGAWPTIPTDELRLEVRRFEQCALLPAGACEPGPTAFTPDQLGIDGSSSATLELALDDELRVVMTGYDGAFDGLPAAEGTGTDLAEVAGAIEASYEMLIGSRIAAGEDAYAVVDDLRSNPAGGFVDGLDGTGLSLSWLHGDAPPVLLQQTFRYVDDRPAPGRGTDALRLPSIHVDDGRVTLFVYAGYQP
jgi:hypothetical protein